MMSDNKYQPSVPEQEGLIISGTPTHDVMPPGITGGMATGVPSQTVGTQGSRDSSATCVQPYRLSPEMNQLKSWIHHQLFLRGQKTDVEHDGNILDRLNLDRPVFLLLQQQGMT